MILQAQAQNFRVYNHLKLDLKPNLNIFLGDNGQGKTAFLEILFVGLRGKSFRPFAGDDFIQNNKEEASVFLSLEKEGQLDVEVLFKKQNNSFYREVFLNNKKTSFSYLKKEFPVLVFTEEDVNAIKGASDQRRRLVDRFLIFNGQGNKVKTFGKTLKEKASLLRSYKKGLCSLVETKKTLEVLNDLFLEHSTELLKERFSYLVTACERLKNLSLTLLPADSEIDFKYFISSEEAKCPEEASLEMKSQLKERFSLELEAGIPLVGPQRHKILFLFNGKNSRTFCSQGQQRALILSLLLSEVLGPKKPLLFLDDVLSELDEKIQKKVLFSLEKTGCQSFLTSCKKIPFELKKSCFFWVKNGTMRPCNYDKRTTTTKP